MCAVWILTVMLSFAFSGCARAEATIPQTIGTSTPQTVGNNTSQTVAESVKEEKPSETASEKEAAPGEMNMQMKIGDTPVDVKWEDNASVQALKKLAEQGLTIQMSMYGGFEQVGSIGQSLPRNDVQTTTGAGDIVLYSGSQIVVFYGSNSWAYTKLGHITDKTQKELADLLSRGNVTITISAGGNASR